MKQSEIQIRNNRRSFLKKSALAAGAATMGAGLFTRGLSAFTQSTPTSSAPLSAGDIAILRFLAAAELIESDLWTQYAELGGIGDNPPIEVAPNQQLNNYQIALSNLDGDGPQYITSNTIDEISHATFLNGYLES
ncbi:MAG TPA: twin-arginine translocation signal domain-containing protein, partial [Candidatus Binatus sp.]|nr:twin-arginine translocation signal domain-containing protein [Candidatus Binatus sp.]